MTPSFNLLRVLTCNRHGRNGLRTRQITSGLREITLETCIGYGMTGALIEVIHWDLCGSGLIYDLRH